MLGVFVTRIIASPHGLLRTLARNPRPRCPFSRVNGEKVTGATGEFRSKKIHIFNPLVHAGTFLRRGECGDEEKAATSIKLLSDSPKTTAT